MGGPDDAKISGRRNGYVHLEIDIFQERGSQRAADWTMVLLTGICNAISGSTHPRSMRTMALVLFGGSRLTIGSTGKCYLREGVNHLEKCGKYRGTTAQLSRDPDSAVRGELLLT